MNGVQIEYLLGLYFLIIYLVEAYGLGALVGARATIARLVLSLVLILLAILHISLIG